ncbi:MAG: hypothetical protein HFJ36_05190 [Clostridia bacterium]|nr:hypothetical protein [Clostridia bacterium]
MIEDEKYIEFLKQIIACVSHGDYYSAKELSQLELDKMEEKLKNKNKRGFWGRP